MSTTYQHTNSNELWDAVAWMKDAISKIRKKKEADDKLQAAKDKKERVLQKVAAYEEVINLCEDPKETKKIKKMLRESFKRIGGID